MTEFEEPLLIQQARTHLHEGRAAEAAQAVRRHLSQGPGTATDYMLLGIALSETGDGLQAIAAMEQAGQMDPGNPSICYNLGLLYRQAHRGREAIAAFERALQVRPDYPAARQALDEAMAEARSPTSASQAQGAGPVRCPHCGMESRNTFSCEWCSRTLAGGVDPTAADAVEVMRAAVISEEHAKLEEGPLLKRTLNAAIALLIRPGAAVNGELDFFFNSPGAPLAVVGLYCVSVLPEALVQLLARPAGPAQAAAASPVLGAVMTVLIGILSILFTSAAIATYNAITGGADSFLGDLGSLALSFAFITAVVAIITAPVALPVQMMGVKALMSGAILVMMVRWIWIVGLEVMLVSAATDLTGCSAIALLVFANLASFVGLQALLGAIK